MKIQRNTFLLPVSVIFFFMLLTSSVSAQISMEGALVSQVADDQGLQPEALSVIYLQEVNLPLTGVMYYEAKILNADTGNVYGTAVDSNGLKVDSTAARQAEKAAYRATYGKLQPALYNVLQSKADTESFEVAIWLKMPGFVSPPRPSPPAGRTTLQDGNEALPQTEAEQGADKSGRGKTEEEIAAAQAQQAEAIAIETEANQAARQLREQTYQQALTSLSEQAARSTQPFVEKLRLQGYEPEYVSLYAPIVIVTLPKAAILNMNSSEEVDTIYAPSDYQDTLDSARFTQKGDWVNLWGYSGTGIKVAILEDSRIEFANPYLPLGVTLDLDGTTDVHAAATAGIVASNHGTYVGIAPGASLYSANALAYIQANITAAMDWAVTQGVHIINNSWGGNTGTTDLDINDRHLDYIVRNTWQVVTVAAGNTAGGCSDGDGIISSPGRGYNVTSVGNYADYNSYTWSDDAMDVCSSYVNPSTGVEKPELAAVGSDIYSTTSLSPWVGNVGTGTSYSAPMAAGTVALMMERDALFKDWPEMPKAILMATALHNIEGFSGLSDKDGAGGMDIRAAFHNTDITTNDYGEFTAASFPIIRNFYAVENELVRVAIVWDSNPTGDYSTDPLQADLDLIVTEPGGSTYNSWSYYNNYEIVEFTAPDTGTYELKINAWRFDGTSEYVGMAWWTGNRVLFAYIPQVFGTPAISRDYYRVPIPSPYFWSVIGIRSPSSNDYDLSLYGESAFADPVDHWAIDASSSTYKVDFVLIDNNHAPAGDYYPEVYKYSGSGGDYPIEFAIHSADVESGMYGPYTMTNSDFIRVWDIAADNGIRKYYAIRPVSGDADLGMGLYDSGSGDFYQNRLDYVVQADINGAGGSETMDYMPDGFDWLGLVVWNNGSTTNTSFYLYTDTSLPEGTILINGGAAYSTSTNVTLTLSGVDAQTSVYQMRFSNDNSSWSSWEPYSTAKAWTLIAGDGAKTVYVQYKNNAEMISASLSDTIVIDTSAPTGTISINAGAAYTNSTSVNLALSASDAGSGVSQMQFSSDGSSWTSWEAYSTSKPWTLNGGDGTKTVYVRYRDNLGNTSGNFTDTIYLDTASPSGSITINGGAAYTNSTSVTLSLTASDAGSGVSQMQFSGDGASWTGWEAYSASKPWTLTGGDGTKYVYVRYSDGAGNASGSFYDTIYLDTSLPSGAIIINGGAAYTTSTSVTLGLSASDTGSGVYQMQFSNDGTTWSTLEAYNTTKSWTLTSADGTKTVYVRYRDNAGNTSGNFTDTIYLDSTSPSGSILINGGALFTHSTSVDLSLSATDAGSGVSQMQFSNDGTTWSTLESYSTYKSWALLAGDGTKTVYVRYRDNAGNTSGSFTDSILLDTTPPTGSILINDGDPYTSSTGVNLNLSAIDTGSGVSQMRLSNDGENWTDWLAYSVSEIWTLPSGDGSKTVYVQYSDYTGWISNSFTDTIILDTAAPTGSVSINGGAAYANTTSVSLALSASDVTSGVNQMRFSNNGSSWTDWEAYSTSKAWMLTSGEGNKTVYVQYADGAGNTSGNFTDTIYLDTTSPSGSIIINGGDTHVNSVSVSLSLSATDAGSGIYQMQFSNDGTTWSTLEAYSTSKSWTLASGDGLKTVYVRYRDHAGNTSGNFTDSIILDTTPPTGSININAGASFTTSTSVTLSISASDTGAGMDAMRFSNDNISWSSWEAYAINKPWTLASGDGVKTVYIQFRDGVNNVSGNFSDTIILDMTAPTGSIIINTGAAFTNSTAVNLTLSATDSGTGVSHMRFSNDASSWSGWEAYATSKAWSLTGGDGSKIVYVQYRDVAGIASGSFSDSIYLDTVLPSSMATSPAHSVNLSFSVSWSGNDPDSGVVAYDVQYRVGTGGSWTDWLIHTSATSAVFGATNPVTVVRGETYYFRVRAYDGAGNMEAYPPGDGDTATYIDVVFMIYIPSTIKH